MKYRVPEPPLPTISYRRRLVPFYRGPVATIYNADCREVFPLVRGVGLVLTDPPYASGARDAEKQIRTRRSVFRGKDAETGEYFSHDAMTTWGLTWFLRSVLTDMLPSLLPGAHVYVFTDWRQTPNVYAMLESSGYRVNHCLVWDKTHYGMGSRWRNQHENVVFGSVGTSSEMLTKAAGSVLCSKPVSPTARVHPTEKPVDLLRQIIRAVPGDLVLDPFCGSGPTIEAAAAEGRRVVAYDVSPHWCEVAAVRAREIGA